MPAAIAVASLPVTWFVGWWVTMYETTVRPTPWMPSPLDLLGPAAEWSATIGAWAAVAAVAAVGAGHRAFVAAAYGFGILAYGVAAALREPWLAMLEWPGPWPPLDRLAWNPPRTYTMDHPGVATAALLAIGVIAGALLAPSREAGQALGSAPMGGRGTAPVRPVAGALAVLGTVVPAVAVAAASVVPSTPTWVGSWGMPDIGEWLGPALAGTALVLAAVLASGRAPATGIVLVLAALLLGLPHVRTWGTGGPDGLLLAAFGPVAAVALAWAWRPLGRQLGALVVPSVPTLEPTPASSVGEGADPHH